MSYKLLLDVVFPQRIPRLNDISILAVQVDPFSVSNLDYLLVSI